MEELADYDIESILLNRVRDVFPHNQTIASVCDAIWNTVSNSVKEECSKKHDYTQEIEKNASILANIVSEMKHKQNELANVALQQKVVEKQINNVIKQQETLEEEIKEEICQEENYALEIVDLNQELEEIKRKQKLAWDGVKRVNKTYKSALQCRIQITDSSEACDKIRIIFFKFVNEDSPRYYVDLTRSAGVWRVDLIHPSLSPKDEEQLKNVLNLRKQQEVPDITAFLCAIRKIFKQHYKS